jgi:hypothetical protein
MELIHRIVKILHGVKLGGQHVFLYLSKISFIYSYMYEFDI